MFNFAVDIPDNNNFRDSWVNLGYFETREKAIEFCQKYFGADKNGCICLVSQISNDETEEE